jgi:hypothetical protein
MLSLIQPLHFSTSFNPFFTVIEIMDVNEDDRLKNARIVEKNKDSNKNSSLTLELC